MCTTLLVLFYLPFLQKLLMFFNTIYTSLILQPYVHSAHTKIHNVHARNDENLMKTEFLPPGKSY